MSRREEVKALDLETHKIQPGLLAPPIVCGSVAGAHGADLFSKQQILKVARDLLLGDEVLAGANIAYDFGCLAATDETLLPLIFAKYARKQVFDVQIAGLLDFIAKGLVRDGGLIDPKTGTWLRDPSTGKVSNRLSLASCTYLWCGRVDAKANDRFRLSYALLEKIPLEDWPADARQYPIDDVRNTYDVAHEQIKVCENLHEIPAQAETHWCEHLSAMWGIRTNKERVDRLGKELAQKFGELEQRVKTFGFFREDGTKNMAAIRERVSKAYGGQPPTTDKGQVATDRTTLDESGDEDLEAFGEVSKVEKLLATYLPAVEAGVTYPVNTRPNILLANGRSSYDGVIQLLPRKGGVRDCFEFRGIGCSSDYSAVELSTLGQVCLWTVGRSKLAEVINAGMDPHCMFAAAIWHEDYKTVFEAVEAKDPLWKDRRQLTKTADFAFPGLMGAVKCAQTKRREGVKLCEVARVREKCGVEKVREWKGQAIAPTCKACIEQAEFLRRAYYDMWPEVPRYFQWIQSHLDAHGNRLEQFVSRRVRGDLTAPAAANTLFSGLAADMAKAALRSVSRECYLERESPLYGARVVVFAHDELILDFPDLEKARAGGPRLSEVMVEQGKTYCPDVKIKAEPALMKFWYKDAAPVFENGKLIPWEPKKAA